MTINSANFKQSEIEMIPNHWELKQLGDLVEIQHGFAFKGEFFSDFETENILLTPGNFKIGGGFKADKLKYTLEDPLDDYVLDAGDLVITMTDLSKEGDTLGFPAIIPKVNGKRFLHNQRIGLVEFKSHSVDKDYLYWLLRTRSYQSSIVNTASGSTVKHTSPGRIKQFSFVCPRDVYEQRAIAKILSDLDAKIELNQRMNKTLEAIGQAIFNHWFVNFEFPNDVGKPYKSSGGEMVYNEKLGKEIPMEWRAESLEGISSNFDSKRVPLSSRQRAENPGAFPYYGATSIIDCVKDYLFDGVYILLGEDGSVIDESGFPILQYVFGKFWVNNHAHVLQGRPVSTEFLYMLLKNMRVDHIVTGAVQPKINQNNMNRLQFAIPNPTVLKIYQQMLDQFFERKRTLENENRVLAKLRDTLLPKLMSGKIRVPLNN